MPLSWVPGLLYGQSYSVQIRAYVGSTWGSYGPACTVTLAANAPGTQLNSASCNATGLVRTSYIYCDAVTGASSYMFTLTSGAYTQSKIRTVNNISLTQYTGLTANTTYTVTVSEYSGGVWSAPVTSPTCTITMGNSIREADPNIREDDEDVSFAAVLYPNPVSSGTAPSVTISGADGEQAMIRIVDLSGREVIAYPMQVEGDEFNAVLNNFPELASGIYFMQVVIADKIENIKFVVE